MGVTNINQRRKSRSPNALINPKQNFDKNGNKRKVILGKNNSKMVNNFKNEYETSDTKPETKTDKTIDSQKKTLEDIPNKNNLEDLRNLKCLSTEKLFKIENHNFNNSNNHDEILPNSYDTNFSSSKSNGELVKNLLSDDIYNELENNNSIDEEDEEENEENEENENKKEEEEEKKKELLITNNIKTVFVDSKISGKEQNEEKDKEKEKENTLTTDSTNSVSSATFDYELNFYRNGNDIRQSYISKLISMQVWNPNMKPKQHNSIIIFDWDDTLLPTSFLTPGGYFNEDIELSESDQEKLTKLEQSVLTLLNEAVEKGNVYIITNAGNGWVEYSAKRFYPSIIGVLSKLKIISARGEYEKLYPGNSRQWKIQAFLNLLKYVDVKLVTNIICIGDSLFEMEAGRILASKFTEAFIKTIKFREAPKLDELLKQLKLVCVQFGSIYSSIKNLTIRVEKKKKEL